MRDIFNLVSSYRVSMLWHAHAYHLNYFKSCIQIYQHKLWYSYGLLVLIFRARSIRSNLGRCMKLQTKIKLKLQWSSIFGSSFLLLMFRPTSHGHLQFHPNPNRKPPNEGIEMRREVQQRKRERWGEQFPIYQNWIITCMNNHIGQVHN